MSFFKKIFSNAKHSQPAPQKAASGEYESNRLYAPVSGRRLDPADLPDPVFAGQMMGPSLVIEPEHSSIHAPVAGTISMMYPTGHAFGVTTPSGAEILVHIGIDTVSLEGKGFKVRAKEGQNVTPDDVIVEFDRKTAEKAGLCPAAMIILTNPQAFDLNFFKNAGDSFQAKEAAGTLRPK